MCGCEAHHSLVECTCDCDHGWDHARHWRALYDAEKTKRERAERRDAAVSAQAEMWAEKFADEKKRADVAVAANRVLADAHDRANSAEIRLLDMTRQREEIRDRCDYLSEQRIAAERELADLRASIEALDEMWVAEERLMAHNANPDGAAATKSCLTELRALVDFINPAEEDNDA